jgi:phosphomevalonate kinase
VRVAAPGKLLLFGAYAVLDGAPAIVIAVDRYVLADGARVTSAPAREVRAAFGAEPAPEVDASALYENGSKLGLGSSAAVLVASLGVRAAKRGEDLASAGVRSALFRAARAAHASAQGGGSGVDVAASTWGGALSYLAVPAAEARPITLPAGLVFVAFWSGTSARTSDLVARVDALRSRDSRAHAAALDAIAAASKAALAGVGRAADAPIVPAAFAQLAALAEREAGAFFPSGAGGGDVGVWLGAAPPSAGFLAHARALAMRPLELGMDHAGVRIRED